MIMVRAPHAPPGHHYYRRATLSTSTAELLLTGIGYCVALLAQSKVCQAQQVWTHFRASQNLEARMPPIRVVGFCEGDAGPLHHKTY